LIRLPPETPCLPFYDGLALIGRAGGWKYIDKTGQVAIDVPPSGKG
jgi:hypothetical protein